MNRPAFKNSELGPIPADWEVKRLGDVCEITTGQKDVNEGCKEGQFPFFTCSKNVFASNSYSFDCEAILVAGNGDVGNLHYYNGRFEAYQRTYVLHGFAENIAYVFHELNHNLMSRLNDGKIGSSIPYITIDQLKGFMFPLPPSVEQRRIAAALSDVDAWIESLDKLIEKKKLVKQGAMQALLSGKTRLPGFGGVGFKTSEIGSIPVDWEVKRLGDLCEVYDGTHQTPHYVDNGVPFFSVENITANDFSNVKHISVEAHIMLSKRIKIEQGDILMTRIGSIGVCRYIDWDVDASFYVSLALLKKRHDAQLDMRYLACASESEMFVAEVRHRSLQFAIPLKINLGQISDIMLCLPPFPEQQAIAFVISDMDAELAALSREKAKAEQIKQGMMQELLTGRVRLKE